MDLLGFQALVGFATCFALVLWTMIPVFLSQKTRSRKLSVRQQQRLQAVLSLANCFACGVFLSTCFFGMVPHAHKHFAHVAMKYGAGPGQDCLSSHSISTPLKQLHQRSPSSDNVSSTNLVTSSASTTTVDPTWTPIFKYLYSKPYPEILFMVGFILTLLIEELVHVCQQTCCANRRKHPSSGHAHYAPVTNFAIPLADTSTASSRHADDNSLSISVPKKGLPLNTTSKTVHNQNDVNTEDVLLDLSSGGPINDSTIQLVKNANGANLNSNLNNGGKSGKTGFSIATTKKHTRWEQEPLVDLDGNESDDDHWDLPAPRLTTHDDHNDSVADLVTDAAGGHGHHHVPTLTGADGKSFSFRALALLFGLSIHNLFEGLALGLLDKKEKFVTVLVGILVHEVLCALAFGISLAQQRLRLCPALWAVICYISCIPLGMVLGIIVKASHGPGADLAQVTLEAISTGTFIYVACVEMFAVEFAHSHEADEGASHNEHHHGNPHGGHRHSHGHQHHHGPSGLVKIFFAAVGCALFVVIASTLKMEE